MDRYDMMDSGFRENQVDGYKVDRDGCMIRVGYDKSANKTAQPTEKPEKLNRNQIAYRAKPSKTVCQKPRKKLTSSKPGFFEKLGREIDKFFDALF